MACLRYNDLPTSHPAFPSAESCEALGLEHERDVRACIFAVSESLFGDGKYDDEADICPRPCNAVSRHYLVSGVIEPLLLRRAGQWQDVAECEADGDGGERELSVALDSMEELRIRSCAGVDRGNASCPVHALAAWCTRFVTVSRPAIIGDGVASASRRNEQGQGGDDVQLLRLLSCIHGSLSPNGPKYGFPKYFRGVPGAPIELVDAYCDDFRRAWVAYGGHVEHGAKGALHCRKSLLVRMRNSRTVESFEFWDAWLYE